jgi:thiaminase
MELPPNKFVFYLKQDRYFLEEFSRFLDSAKQKTSDTKLKEWLDSLYLSTVDFEIKMQKQLLNSLASLSSSSDSIANAVNCDIIIPSKTTFDYTCYLNHTSSAGTFSEIVSLCHSQTSCSRYEKRSDNM